MPLFSIPLSGLTASSTAMSTIANNLANLTTVGYKGSSTQFNDLFYQTLGMNGSGDPIQVGGGTAVSATSSNMTSGSTSATGVPTDVSIMGDGFFIVQQNGTNFYTRAGNFSVSSTGDLQTPNGYQVLGYSTQGGVIPPGTALAPLHLDKGQINPPKSSSSVQLTTNLDAATLNGTTPLSTSVTLYDSLGAKHVLSFNFTKVAAGSWSCNITIPNADVTPPPAWVASTAYIAGQSTSPIPANGHFYQCTVAGTSGATQPASWPTDGSILSDGTVTWKDMGTQTSLSTTALNFDSNGKLTSPTGNVTGITASGLADGASNLTFQWTMYNATGQPMLSQVAGPSTTPSILQDGYGGGSLTDFNIGTDGMIMGTFSNGKTGALGEIALANFSNTQGLARVGNNDFSATLASGPAVIGAPGTGGLGQVSGGSLELSNVDIATEFSALIVAQRDYEANARTVTTFDRVMEDTINLKSGA